MSQAAWDITSILHEKALVAHFQPIVNIMTRQTVGIEALIRGVDPRTGRLIPPNKLFQEADRRGLSLELDRAARETALFAYKSSDAVEKPILFLNLNASVLTSRTLGSNRFFQAIQGAGLDPSSVAIEVVESSMEDSQHLISFTRRYRELGFLIVIDDFGARDSNLTRLNDIRPDIIKIDKAIVSGIHNDTYKRSIVASVVELAHKNGALCLAEGIETVEDLSYGYLLQADLFQGYHFARPSPHITAVLHEASEKMHESYPSLEQAVTDSLEGDSRVHLRLRSFVTDLGKELVADGSVDPSCEPRLQVFLSKHSEAACVYLLDKKGRQTTDTIWRHGTSTRKLLKLFQPAPRGFDHSLKNYYVYLRTKDEFFSDPYISLATGNLCRTMALRLKFPKNGEAILCVDFEEEPTSVK